jgi:hypothetical protein
MWFRIRFHEPAMAFSRHSGTPGHYHPISTGVSAVSNLLFFRRSFAYRNAALDLIRKARAMPPGSDRRAARQLARALNDLAKTEAWLEGQMPSQRAATDERLRKAATA